MNHSPLKMTKIGFLLGQMRLGSGALRVKNSKLKGSSVLSWHRSKPILSKFDNALPVKDSRWRSLTTVTFYYVTEDLMPRLISHENPQRSLKGFLYMLLQDLFCIGAHDYFLPSFSLHHILLLSMMDRGSPEQSSLDLAEPMISTSSDSFLHDPSSPTSDIHNLQSKRENSYDTHSLIFGSPR